MKDFIEYLVGDYGFPEEVSYRIIGAVNRQFEAGVLADDDIEERVRSFALRFVGPEFLDDVRNPLKYSSAEDFYKALERCGLLVNRKSDHSNVRVFTSAEVREIVCAYYHTRGNVAGMLRRLNLDIVRVTLRDYLVEGLGLEVKQKPGPYRVFGRERSRFVEAYSSCGGNVLAASRELERSTFTVARVWREEGLEVRTRGYNKLPEEKLQVGFRRYVGGESIRRVAKDLGIARTTFRKYLIQAGLK